ncbi:MAG: Rab family GTPase [Candidatus Thorarchaeota archaeon]
MSHIDYTFKVLVFGDDSYEKTTLTKRYCYNIFNPSTSLTIGVDFHIKTIELNNNRIKLQIWDVGGEERFRFLLPTYCLGARAAILIYDITRSSTLDNIAEWISIVRSNAGNIPIILIGSKLDLGDTFRRVSREEGISTAENYNLAAFAEVSSKTGQNVDQVFRLLTELTLGVTGDGMYNNDRYGREGMEGLGSRARGRATQRREVRQDIKNKFKRKPVSFKINDFLELKLENGKTNIYVGGLLFRQCKYLLLNINSKDFESYENIESIDEAAEKLDHSMERRGSNLPSRTEFWGHCSNLQAWYENNYDTRILHRNLAFPLLKALADAGDKLAKKVFKEQLAIRLESGYPSVVMYLVKQDYLDHLTEEELDTILENPKFIKSIPNWFTKFKDIPKWFEERIRKKLMEMKYLYCGC